MEQIGVVPNIYNIIYLFNEYNNMCFGGELPRPILSLMHSKKMLGYFSCDIDEDGEINNPTIEISDSYEYTEDKLRDVLVHEMIHYYLAYTQKDLNFTHGKEFKRLANFFNSNFGMNISEKVDITNMNKVNNGGWLSRLFS